MATSFNDEMQRACTDQSDPSDFVPTRGAAEELHLSESMMNKMRCTGDGPPFYKIGSRVFYSRQELRDWRRSRRRTSTSVHQAA